MDDDCELLARTLWAEARGEGVLGMAAVAAVIVNRAAKGGWWGGDIKSVCLKPYQFSCWNENDPNRKLLLRVGDEDRHFAAAKTIAELAVGKALADTTDGATHYHTKRVSPSWSAGKTPCRVLGNHQFYNNI